MTEKDVPPRGLPLPIEDYALIGDCHAAALVGRDGAIDWLCLPRFDSPACFAALLGTPDNGSWLIAPRHSEPEVRRSYREGTLVLETVFTTPEGEVALIDTMPLGLQGSHIIRRVEGRRGRVAMNFHLKLRFDFGAVTPWVTRDDGGEGRWCTCKTEHAMTPTPICYAIARVRRTESGRPAASIWFNATTPMAASVCWAAKPRARNRGPISALYRPIVVSTSERLP